MSEGITGAEVRLATEEADGLALELELEDEEVVGEGERVGT